MKTDIKFYQGTNKMKVFTRKAADTINTLCHYDSIVKGNKTYNLPEDLPAFTDGMYKNLLFYLITAQTELNVVVELDEDKLKIAQYKRISHNKGNING